jgi:mannose-6-phosphate isomerase-like protein (cupin superfamily)
MKGRVALLTVLFVFVACELCCRHSVMQKSHASTASASIAWQPSKSVTGAFYRALVGDPDAPGRFEYQIKVPARARIAAHRHSVAMHVKVLSGSKVIVMGEPLALSRARHFAAGESLLIPAHSWHQEWWSDETVEQIEGVGPMETEYKTKQ